MRVRLSSREVPLLLVRESSSSTNSELVAQATSDELPDFTTVVTDHQTAGRGRLGRVWTAPAGASLAVSVLVSNVPQHEGVLPHESLGWLPLLAGVAMCGAVGEVVGDGRVGMKWPNDIQVDGYKVCGILSELVQGGRSDGVVIGAGLNIAMTTDQLPVPTATSLVLSGAEGDPDLPDRVLAAYLRRLVAVVHELRVVGGDAVGGGLRDVVLEHCTTIGRSVRVEYPGGRQQFGVAVGLDRLGRLELRDETGRVDAIAAGDIVHLR